ncbi:UDP-glucose 4-epimerase [Actinoplanes sp. SE50]|uniref:NAD-dependent epimerase/dehydratase family protein n=1 Tax=unclassified Actinoplanes TaxID=2626549 RepID=UPI00023EC28F|nr:MULTISPECIES: NAD(P)-dependent oxidoreductase [unclassified Actinoplanes]AEV84108.1 NAD-dependent epimerase/dehydratase [Actinoplanes sp. SE50/110]ATO82500.1 UDP-glucose 4-epimerase [Actinoplanes sp. SE50]SLL99907.1 UDP-glucose 4-epimerase [Actinoplanes sp. SE50/110]
MPRIAVTGGGGKLGRAVVQDLLDHDFEVVNLDREPPRDPVCPHTRVDLTDYGQVAEALTAIDSRYTGIDAVVHLAAIPGPGVATNAVTFANNITASYNVFAAARAAGIKRVVWASSETVLGLPFDTPPPYLPVDEEYAARPETSYSLAKHLDEQMAAQFCRWDPELTMIGLRFSNVMEPDDYAAFPSFEADPRRRIWNLWGYIDARDGAQAVRRALSYDRSGLEIFIIANADTVMSRPTAELAAEYFPELPLTREIGEHQTLLSIDKARRLLGYDPRHGWRR